ncbi:hypothetical protein FACS189496_5480 [Bacilli bacterium]|nr:hypothetical protein FACS189496_5480 [Bacilli bacterium]
MKTEIDRIENDTKSKYEAAGITKQQYVFEYLRYSNMDLYMHVK